MTRLRYAAVLAAGAILLVVVPLAAADPPGVTITSEPASPTNSTSAGFSFTSPDATATFDCRLDSGSFGPCAAFNSLGDGTHTFTVRATNATAAPNTSEDSYTWTVDTIPPTLTLTNQTFDRPTYTDPVPITYTATASDGTGSGLASGSPSCTPASGSTFALGTTPVSCTATDNAGNTAGPISFSVIVTDTTPAAAPGISGGPTGFTNNATPTFTFEAVTGASSYQCSIDDATPATACSPPTFTATPLGEGPHTFYVTAKDTNNPPSAASSRVFSVDTTEPVLTLANKTFDAPTYTGPVAVTYTATASDGTGSGLASGSPSCTPASGSNFPLGPTTVSCTATDKATNTATGTFTVTVTDTTAPGAPGISGGPTGFTNNATPTFTFEAVTGASSYQCSIDDATPATSCNLTFTPTTALGGGPHTFYVTAKDIAGNTSAASTRAFTVDPSPPVLTGPGNLTVEADGPGGTRVTFTVSASDGTPPVALLPGAITCTPASPAQFPLGTGNVTCTATDAAGNVGKLSFTVTVRDTTPPAINAPDASFTATSASGISRSDPALASYLSKISATDLVSGATLTTNTPETLPIGDTKIVVTARDGAGNESQKTVTLTVLAPGKPAPPPDFTPPGAVRGAAARAADHTVVLTWALPADKDVAFVRIERSVVGKTGSTVAYRGLGRTFTSKGLSNGVAYRFTLVVVDKAGNSSQPVVVSATPKALLLALPKPGAVVVKPPLLRWAPVSSARYFNVQLYRGGVKILSAWPTAAHLQLASRWKYDGRAYTLKPGLYIWFVWPGVGARADAVYGDLLGQSKFSVVVSKKV